MSPVPPPPGVRPPPSLPVLSLRRRSGSTRPPLEVSEASAAARETIRSIVTATRSPFGDAEAESRRIAELERTLRQLEAALAERERLATETEARQADRERDLAEMEALLLAREKLIAATRRPAARAEVSPEERAALDQLRGELERQEASVKEARQALREREQFLDDAEAKLFEKVQAQQEKENELEQRDEDLRARARQLREREAAIDPQAAAALKAEDERAKQRDEFNE